MKKSLLYQPTDNGAAICGVCAHRCRVSPGMHGRCHVRYNDGGALVPLNYGRAVAEHDDPVEKKPLYHFFPSSRTYSVAAAGCNFVCDFCQNWGISQASGIRAADFRKIGVFSGPQSVVDRALQRKCASVSFTYSEPTVFFEYALDIAKLAKEAGLKTIFVSNGYMTAESLSVIGPYLDACNIDLKSFRDDFYRGLCGASLAPVLNTLKAIRSMGIWLEVTTLVIPGENDSDGELADIARFIAAELGVDTPWHVSRFFPQHRMSSRSATSASVVARAAEIGREAGLRFVYTGNMGAAQDTICPACGKVVVSRSGFNLKVCGIDADTGTCGWCGAEVAGIFF